MKVDTEQILRALNASLNSRKLYPAGHPSVTVPARRLEELILDYLKESDKLIVGVVDGTIIVEDIPVDGSEEQFHDIIEHLRKNGVGAIIFMRGAGKEELSRLLDILTEDPPNAPDELEGKLRGKGVTHINLKLLPKEKKSFLEVHGDAVRTVKNAMDEVRMGKIPKSNEVKNVAKDLTEMIFTDSNAMMGLAMIKSYDEYLYNHSVNVSIFSISLGRFMSRDENELRIIGMASLLHDIGKTGVSEHIIRKPGNLSFEEWEKVKEHPVLGSRIAQRMEGIDSRVTTIIYEHHVRYDHSGYPSLKDTLHPLSLIVSIADAYDALTTLRVYQKPFQPVEAMKILNDLAGKHFDPSTVKAFEDMIGLYPVGTVVRLSSNEVGVVTKANTNASDRPVVKVIYDGSGSLLGKPYVADLTQKDFQTLTVVGTVDPLARNMDVGAFLAKEVTAEGR
ncbi:MAG: HD-GYP domain-containing protein [Deltaproteobacteria bacterium]|nr:HD-GYP domain-containing protein [Deltaproteobacteria bacterium]